MGLEARTGKDVNDGGIGRKRVVAYGVADCEMEEMESEMRCVAELKNDFRYLGRSEAGSWRS